MGEPLLQRIYLENQVGAVSVESESNEEAPCLYDEVYKSHNERSEWTLTSRKDKVTNVEIRCRTGLPSMADILIENNLRHVRWLGHVHRINNNRLSKKLLHSQLCLGIGNA